MQFYLSCPTHTFPDTKVDQDPCDGQCYCQWHSDLPWFFQAIRKLMHIPSKGHRKALLVLKASDLRQTVIDRSYST